MIKQFNEFVNESAEYENFDAKKCQELIENKLKIKANDVLVDKDDRFVKSAYIYINYTKPEDYPNGLVVNSCRFIFSLRFAGNSLELHTSPHAWLSPYDREHDFKYLAMRSAIDMGKECGVAKFRKSKIKDEDDVANKITKYVNSIMDIVNVYTGGYPYHKSELTVPLKDAYKK